MKNLILKKIYNGNFISYKESKILFEYLIKNQLKLEEISAILISMKIRGESPDEIAGAAKVFLKYTKKFPHPNYLFADIVGTGGDGKNSINISTASAFIAAGCGVKIAKHGNYSTSGICGSANVLSLFGINLNMDPKKSREALDKINICFLFAPYYYKIFKNISYIRNILKTRTIFNILGPIINPAKPPLSLIGVYNKNLLFPMAKTLKILGYKRAVIIYGSGMDEVVLHDKTEVVELKENNIISYSLFPKDFGLKSETINSFIVNSPIESFNILKKIFMGKIEKKYASLVAVNVAVLLKLFGNENLRDNTSKALEEIYSGNAYSRIMSLVEKSNLE